MPVSGKVIAVNEELTNSPELVNEDPYKNFFIEIEVFDESELKTLIDEESYKKTL
jgi:glycine cleavage system H protein